MKQLGVKDQPQVLETKLWSVCRNPNYFGELLIYGGFNLCAMHWIPLAYLALVVVGLWLPNMRKKDASLSRFEEFKQYK